jgi:hypothetical protein
MRKLNIHIEIRYCVLNTLGLISDLNGMLDRLNANFVYSQMAAIN